MDPLKQIDHSNDTIFNNPHKRFEFLLASGFILSIGFLLVFIFWAWKPVTNFIADQIPYSFEEKLAAKILNEVDLLKSSEQEKLRVEELQKAFSHLQKSLPNEFQQIKFYISNDRNPNAFALPGGHIIFTKGLLENAKNIEEILGVMAHEVSHITNRHSLKSLMQSAGVFILVDFIIGGFSGTIAAVLDQSSLLLTSSYSREFETEADNNAWNILVQSNVNPNGMISFFETLQIEEKKSMFNSQEIETFINFYSTHPSTSDRIDNLKARLNKLETQKNFAKIDINFNLLKNGTKE